MGLDMYFTRQPKTPGAYTPVISRRYSHEVGYFRKHNALHQWMVEHAQAGIDECQSTELTPECLTKCFDIVKVALVLRDTNYMPPSSGCYFGSTAVDESYWNKMIETYYTLQTIIETTDWQSESVWYQSSW